MRLGLAAVLFSLLLAACPEPASPGFDPSNPRPLDPSIRKPPPPGAPRPDEPPPPPRPRIVDPGPPEPVVEEAPPAPPPDAPPSKEDLSAKFSIRLGANSPVSLSIEGDPKSASVREVKSGKEGEGSLKIGQLGAKEVQALLSALDKLEWWKLAPNDAATNAQQVTVSRGKSIHTFALVCAKGTKSCPNAAADALLKGVAAKAKAPPETKLLKFKAGAPGKGAPSKGHCAERERPNYVTCVADSGTLDHCTGKGKKFVCFSTPFDGKGVAVSSDVAPDEKKKAPAAAQPWAIELAADRCVATQGHWRCDHDTPVSRVSTGKTWLAWPPDGPPVPVKAGYPE